MTVLSKEWNATGDSSVWTEMIFFLIWSYRNIFGLQDDVVKYGRTMQVQRNNIAN